MSNEIPLHVSEALMLAEKFDSWPAGSGDVLLPSDNYRRWSTWNGWRPKRDYCKVPEGALVSPIIALTLSRGNTKFVEHLDCEYDVLLAISMTLGYGASFKQIAHTREIYETYMQSYPKRLGKVMRWYAQGERNMASR